MEINQVNLNSGDVNNITMAVASPSSRQAMLDDLPDNMKDLPIDPVRAGRQKHPLYMTWRGILKRCLDKNSIGFKRYGGRGISVCVRWQESFWDFVDDVGQRPSIDHSIDRFPDNNGNYQPGNVRWATRSEQNSNRRDNIRLTAHGKTQTLQEWVKETGVPKSTLFNRILRGWADEDVICKPIRDKSKPNTLFPIGALEKCRELGVKPSTIASRITRGWTFEEAIKIPVARQKGPGRNGKYHNSN